MNALLAPRPARQSRLFGLALGCALASCAALAAWAATANAPAAPDEPPVVAPALLPHGPMLDHLLDDAKASPTQRAQVHQLLDAAEADLRAGRAAARGELDQLVRLFEQPVVDAAAVEALRLRLEQRHDAESRRLTQALVDLSQVLGPDQRRQIVRALAARPLPGARPDFPAAQP
jgi:Spy/CpxP family protein refolding chaperone